MVNFSGQFTAASSDTQHIKISARSHMIEALERHENWTGGGGAEGRQLCGCKKNIHSIYTISTYIYTISTHLDKVHRQFSYLGNMKIHFFFEFYHFFPRQCVRSTLVPSFCNKSRNKSRKTNCDWLD